MRRAFADFSLAVPVAFAAGLGLSLWIFMLPAGVVQKGPRPVLPAVGGAGRVTADLPVPAGRRASEVRKAASAHPKLVARTFVPRRQPAAAKARRVHDRARADLVRVAPPAPKTPVRVAPPAPKTPVTKTWLFRTTEKDKARGRARGHAPKPKAATASLPPGRGKALGRSKEQEDERGKAHGRSNGHEDRLPPGQAKKTPPASAPGLQPPPKGNGGGNGRKGEKN
jgi:hypothetical protein